MDYLRLVNEAMYPSEETRPPLPKASMWFVNGVPQMVGAARRKMVADDEGPDDDDDEIVVMNEKLSFKDPISLMTIDDPLSSTVCKHHFQREIILAYIQDSRAPVPVGGSKRAPCPVTGCNAVRCDGHSYRFKLTMNSVHWRRRTARRPGIPAQTG